jgi:aspartyl-tRNA synthetase
MNEHATLPLEGIGDWRRSHTCGALTKTDASSTATLMGWVHRVRDHGGVLFVDLRDRYGLTQVVFHPESGGRELLERAAQLGHEWVIAVRGPVMLRPPESVNPELPTGAVELDVRELKVLASADPLPFQVNDEQNLASEDLRLKYRYLDLRRPALSEVLVLRHRVAQAARAHLSRDGFLEIETPILVKQTPEGARDYVVPSRVHPGSFYALPQSPQLYKQTLMIAGFDRYFQLARCLRDEDLRADRQPEHTQIDLEMSFVTEEDVFTAVEGMFAAVWRECLGTSLVTPFPRLTFNESMLRIGSDKPDLRFGLEFTDVTKILARSPRNVVANGAKAHGGVGVALTIPGGAEISGTQLRKYEDVVKAAGGGGLSFSPRPAPRPAMRWCSRRGPGSRHSRRSGCCAPSSASRCWRGRSATGGSPGCASSRCSSGIRRTRRGRRATTCSRCRTPSISSISRATPARCTPSSTTWCSTGMSWARARSGSIGSSGSCSKPTAMPHRRTAESAWGSTGS